MKNRLAYLCYRLIRWIIWVFYPKIKIVGLENLPSEPCVVAGNHAQMHGPIAAQLYFPGNRAIRCAGEMMDLKQLPDYAFTDFWSKKPLYFRWFYRILSYLIAPISVCVFNNASTIAVYRGAKIIQTFRQTQNHLEQGDNVVIFPEEDVPRNHIVYEFQRGFVDVARQYYKRTGKKLPFVPMYIAPNLKAMYLGEPICFDPDRPIQEERERICTYLMEQITDMAVHLPRHKVIPYPNIAKGEYPFNIPGKEQQA